MKIGALIVAAGLSSRMKAFKPMLELGGSTIIKETIASLRKAQVQDITVVVGHRGEELAKHLEADNVTIVENPDYSNGEMFHSVRLGLSKMKEYDLILFSPGDVPLFSAKTARVLCTEMEKTGCLVVSPVYQGKKGHPIALNGKIIDDLLTHDGEQGLRGALEKFTQDHRLIEVIDQGILLDADRPEDYERLKNYAASIASHGPVSIKANVDLIREIPFWNHELNQLLVAIKETGSLNKACQLRSISYTKGWNAIKKAEYRLGFPLLNTETGGVRGGGSQVTEEGEVIMDSFAEFYAELNLQAEKLFKKHFQGLFQQADSK